MQRAVFNRATMRVVNTTEVSDRVTADSIKNGLSAKKQTGLWRLTIFGWAVSVAILASLAPAQAQGQPGSVPPPAQIAALQSQVADLQQQINTLKTQLANVLTLSKYVIVDENNTENGVKPTNIVFHNANIHIVSGSGATDDTSQTTGAPLSGLGNLIIGYDENPPSSPNQSPDRSGSHNLVIGRYHSFTTNAFGGLVAGEGNTIKNGLESVMGGLNTVSGYGATICGGLNNTVTANGTVAVVVGGANTNQNVVPNNTASGFGAVVIGGAYQMAGGTNSIAPQNLLLFP
jgi:hypothetical protein